MPVYQPVKPIKFNENEFPEADPRPVCLFAGMFNASFDSAFMVKGFEENGYRVIAIDWQKIKHEASTPYQKEVLNEETGKFKEEIVREDGNAVLQGVLISKALKERPQLIFLHIQSDTVLNTLVVDQLEQIAPTVIYNFDCRPKEKMEWLYNLVPYVKLVCFSNLEDVVICRSRGHYNTMVIQSSADYDVYKKLPNQGVIKSMFPHEIVFIGNRYDNTNMEFPEAKQRTEMVEFLQKEYGERFKAWGMGWAFSRRVNRQEEVMIYNSCKIAITQNNFCRADYQSDRIYRAMGCGAFTIIQFFPNVNKYFNKYVASAWLNFEMLKEEIDNYMKDDETREQKAALGYEFVREKHSWKNRVQQIIIALKNVSKTSL